MDKEIIVKELSYKTSRSGGAGGQHVNKVESKVTLVWDVEQSAALSPLEKTRIRERLANRLQKEGLLQMDSSTERSQIKNKELVTLRFFRLLDAALEPDKPRIPTKTPRSQVFNRLDRKKKQAQKKQSRRRNFGLE